MCDSVVPYAFRFWLHPDRFLERSMHKFVVQGWNFTFTPQLSSLNTIQSRKGGKCRGKFLPAQKPYCLHRTKLTCAGDQAAILFFLFAVIWHHADPIGISGCTKYCKDERENTWMAWLNASHK